MSIRTIYTTDYDSPRHTVSGRLTVRLSDGTYAAICPARAAGVAVFLIYWSATLSGPWTSVGQVTAINGSSTWPRAMTFAAATIDDSDNIHLVGSTWTNAGTTRAGASYWKFTKGSGYTWSPGSQVVLLAPNSGQLSNSTHVDIDFVGAGANGRPIVAISTTTATLSYLRYYLINGSTAVLLATPGTINQVGATNIAKYVPLKLAAVSGRHANESDNTLVFMYVYLTGNGSYKYGLARTDNAGATVTGYSVGNYGGAGATMIKLSWAGDREIILNMYGSGPKITVQRFNWDAVSYSLTRDIYAPFIVPSGAKMLNYSWTPFIISRNLIAIFYPGPYEHALVAIYADITSGVAVLSSGVMYENMSNLPGGINQSIISIVHGNYNRALERNQIDPWPMVEFVTLQAPNKPVYGSVPLRAPLVPNTLIPAQGATVDTDIPTLGANIGTDANGTQSDFVVTWQLSTSPAFTASISSSYGWVNGGGTPRHVLEIINKLTAQGTWYLRARTTDRYGKTSSWSSTTQFTNKHLPVAIPDAPTDDQVVALNAGTVLLTWHMYDTSPTSTQSAYEIVVTLAADGTVLYDSGVVASTVGSALATVDPMYQDAELAWTVQIYDDQGIAGPVSDLQMFYISLPPTPNIIAPVNGSTVTSGRVTVSWTSGIIGLTKSEYRWRVVLQEGETLIHDSGTQQTGDVSYQLPVGSIHTGHSYVLTVTVWDNLNLAGSSVIAFAANFPLPARALDMEVFSYNFEKRGFLWIGWTNRYIDPDFVNWNVYRRARGDDDWTLLESVYENQPFYGLSDYEAAANTQYEYVVTQVVNVSGSGDIVESALIGTVIDPIPNSYYWLIDPNRLTPPVPVYQVTADSVTDEWERSTYTIIGRGRHTDIGEHLGISGSLTTQARDRPIGTPGPAQNCLADPAFQDNMPFSPEWQFSFPGTGTVIPVVPFECPPSGHEQVLRIDVGPNQAASFQQNAPASIVTAPNDRSAYSVYLSDTLAQYRFNVAATVTWLDDSGTVITQQTSPCHIIEDWQGNTNWIRYGVQFVCTVPANTANFSGKARVSFSVTDTSGNGLAVLVNGAMANYGNFVIYGDGDAPGWDWEAGPYVSASYTPGYHTARAQRQAIVDIAAQQLPRLLFRNPFGDIWNVNVADITFARLAGVGSQVEYGDATIPYSEQAD